MAIFIDSQIERVTLTTPDGDSVEAVVVPVAIPVSEVQAEIDAFDTENGTHPLAAQAKPIARAFLDALEAHVEEVPLP